MVVVYVYYLLMSLDITTESTRLFYVGQFVCLLCFCFSVDKVAKVLLHAVNGSKSGEHSTCMALMGGSSLNFWVLSAVKAALSFCTASVLYCNR